MEPFIPNILPIDFIDWSAHVSLIGQANAALARYDGMLQGILNSGGYFPLSQPKKQYCHLELKEPC
jgi:hypothetical protein